VENRGAGEKKKKRYEERNAARPTEQGRIAALKSNQNIHGWAGTDIEKVGKMKSGAVETTPPPTTHTD
jgi:hypothetical protein